MNTVLIREWKCTDVWGSYPIAHGAYYSTYFEDSTIQNFDVWAAISTNLQRFDVLSNGDLVVGYKADIK